MVSAGWSTFVGLTERTFPRPESPSPVTGRSPGADKKRRGPRSALQDIPSGRGPAAGRARRARARSRAAARRRAAASGLSVAEGEADVAHESAEGHAADSTILREPGSHLSRIQKRARWRPHARATAAAGLTSAGITCCVTQCTPPPPYVTVGQRTRVVLPDRDVRRRWCPLRHAAGDPGAVRLGRRRGARMSPPSCALLDPGQVAPALTRMVESAP